jgi:hypothetical protein
MTRRPLLEDREILWEKRHYLVSQPQALPKVLLAAHSWDYACLSDLHTMLYTWAPLEPVTALQLLLPWLAHHTSTVLKFCSNFYSFLLNLCEFF